MKLATIILLIGGMAFAESSSTTKDFQKKINDTFPSQPNLQQAIWENLQALDATYPFLHSDAEWIEGSRRQFKSTNCLRFLLINEKEQWEKIQPILDDYRKHKGYDKLLKENFKKLLNRELREKTREGIYDIPVEDGHKFCVFKLDEKFLEDKIKSKKEMDEKSVNEPLNFSSMNELHPRLLEILKKMDKDAMERKMPLDARREFVFKTFRTHITPTLDMQASMEFLPGVERKCPGVMEKLWEKCKDLPTYQMLMKNIPKMFCVQDHASEIGEDCLKN